MTFSTKKSIAFLIIFLAARVSTSFFSNSNKSKTIDIDIPKIKWKPDTFPKDIKWWKPREPFVVAYNKPDYPIAPAKQLNNKQKLIERIKDYTVQIVHYNGWLGSKYSGTGWFLDYEIPEKGKYPTKWFLATNAHVIDDYEFKDDPYNQNPKTRPYLGGEGNFYLYKWESGGYDEEIFRKEGIDFEDPEFWSSEEAKKYNPYINSTPPSRDILTIKKNWHRNKETPSMHIRITDPKLLYAAFDQLQYPDGSIINYFLDFAVVEINFPDEDSAKKMTQQVFDKEKNERINFLDEVNKNSQFYTAGYPGNSYNRYRPVGNYSRTKDLASNRGLCYLLNNYPQAMLEWNGEKYRNDRCYYELDNFYAGAGSSGSMVVDESGTLLGLHSRGRDGGVHGYTQPIRGKYQKHCQYWFYYCQETLEYDLITGSRFQSTSYKQQLLKYLPHVNTYLKDKHQWK